MDQEAHLVPSRLELTPNGRLEIGADLFLKLLVTNLEAPVTRRFQFARRVPVPKELQYGQTRRGRHILDAELQEFLPVIRRHDNAVKLLYDPCLEAQVGVKVHVFRIPDACEEQPQVDAPLQAKSLRHLLDQASQEGEVERFAGLGVCEYRTMGSWLYARNTVERPFVHIIRLPDTRRQPSGPRRPYVARRGPTQVTLIIK